jgi:queuine tRNA-ribosyltransferase
MATRCFSFEVLATDPGTGARCGRIRTAHGDVQTPAFMPVGTYGAVKGLAPSDLEQLGAEIVLSNAYHLEMRPGSAAIEELGGLHRFMGWDRPILTDSGGFQVFSLKSLRKVDDDGVSFRSPVDGSKHRFTPESVVELQRRYGVDVAMPLDVCTPWRAERDEVDLALRRTVDWAERSLAARGGSPMALFGIVQGGFFPELRARCAEQLAAMPFDGLALGGLSVGEPREVLIESVQRYGPLLPPERPRYLMGVGYPGDLVEAVAAGIDMFDCVLPTRNARNGTLFVDGGRLVIKNARFRSDERPVEEGCECACCRRFSRAYLRHLYVTGEMLAARLMTTHNLHHYMRWMERIRRAITEGSLGSLLQETRHQRAQQAHGSRGKESG